MRLVTFCNGDAQPRIGVLINDDLAVVDLQGAAQCKQGAPHSGLVTMQALIEGGEQTLQLARELCHHPPSSVIVPTDQVMLMAPLPLPQQIRSFSVFEQHGRQSLVGMQRLIAKLSCKEQKPPYRPEDVCVPDSWYQRPVYYKGNRFSVTGHGADIVWPNGSNVIDFELEMAAVIGRTGVDIDRAEAANYIFGFLICNDLSARDMQVDELALPLGPAKSKDFDGGNSLGPCIVTADEIDDPYNLEMIARVNGEEWGSGSTSHMQHRFEDMIVYVSQGETLHAGEIFLSGCVGNGCGLELGKFPDKGDVIELEIEQLGRLANRIV